MIDMEAMCAAARSRLRVSIEANADYQIKLMKREWYKQQTTRMVTDYFDQAYFARSDSFRNMYSIGGVGGLANAAGGSAYATGAANAGGNAGSGGSMGRVIPGVWSW